MIVDGTTEGERIDREKKVSQGRALVDISTFLRVEEVDRAEE